MVDRPKNHPINRLLICTLGCILNLLLLLLPFLITGSLTLSPLAMVFAILISAWVIVESLANNSTPCSKPRHLTHAWLPATLGLGLLLLLWISLFDYFSGNFLSEHFLVCALTGTLFITSGILLRFTAIKTLDKFFLSHVAVFEDHELVTSGIYKSMRHPSESGFIMLSLGFPIFLSSPNGLLFSLPMLCLVLLRIHWEDSLLSSFFGNAFQVYKTNTRALLPRFGFRNLTSVCERLTKSAR